MRPQAKYFAGYRHSSPRVAAWSLIKLAGNNASPWPRAWKIISCRRKANPSSSCPGFNLGAHERLSTHVVSGFSRVLFFRRSRFEIERNAVQVFSALNLDENAESFLFRIAVLFRLDESFPDLLVLRSGLANRRSAVEAPHATLGQHAGLSQLRFSKEDRDLGSVLQIGVRCALAALPQRKMFVVEHHGAASRRHLRKPIRQHGGDEAYVHRKRRIDVLVQNLRDRGQTRILI